MISVRRKRRRAAHEEHDDSRCANEMVFAGFSGRWQKIRYIVMHVEVFFLLASSRALQAAYMGTTGMGPDLDRI